MRKGMLTGLMLFGFLQSEAQPIWVNRGAAMYSGAGALIQASGGLQIDSGGLFRHGGEMLLDGSLKLQGLLSASGNLSVSGDILNNGEIRAESGTLDLRGGLQTVSGSGKNRFYRLRLSGSETKFLEQHADASYLELNDRVLHTGKKKFYVLNGDPAAISRLSGYVSSDSGGALYRILLPGQDYLFPVGGQQQYAPVSVRPVSGTDTAGIRFAFSDAGLDGLSRNFIPEEICKTNSLFFNVVARSDTNALDMLLYYPQVLSGPYRSLLSTGTANFVSWETRYEPTFSQQDTFLLVSARINGNTGEAFLLGRKRPEQPVITGRDSVCSFDEVFYTAAPEGELSWTAGGGSLVVSGNAASFSSGQPGPAFVSVTVSDSLGCSSLPAKKDIVVMPVPVAGIGIQEPDYPYEHQVWRLTYTGSGASGFTWYREGIPAGFDSTWQVSFDAPGTYPVQLEIINDFGCRNIQDTTLTVFPGLEIPDSFSPNGDGVNDELLFLNSGMISFSLSIYNRWGNLVFSSSDPKFSWDGRDLKGEPVPAGTYFYRLDAAIPGKQYKQQGSITVLF